MKDQPSSIQPLHGRRRRPLMHITCVGCLLFRAARTSARTIPIVPEGYSWGYRVWQETANAASEGNPYCQGSRGRTDSTRADSSGRPPPPGQFISGRQRINRARYGPADERPQERRPIEGPRQPASTSKPPLQGDYIPTNYMGAQPYSNAHPPAPRPSIAYPQQDKASGGGKGPPDLNRPPDDLLEDLGFTESPEEAMQEDRWAKLDMSLLDKEAFFERLESLYKKKLFPLERNSKYELFHSDPLTPADFKAKPMVLLLGQYSVGKTSFIRSLLKTDFPGIRVGPEPTTDRFMAVMHGKQARSVPGHALSSQVDKPFQAVQRFGSGFLTKFEAAEVPASILRNVTMIDTPGILSGEKQRLGRDYDYLRVIQWFAEHADLIIIMFDAHKLDISDELTSVMKALKPHQDKVRIVLNKADQINSQQLMRVYGALMWSLGKVLNTPEVCRVYIGSFWDRPLANRENRVLLEREKHDLLQELASLPNNAVTRRCNELVKRARSVKVHAYLIHYLRKHVPRMWGKKEKQLQLIDDLEGQFRKCARRYGLALGDFPNVHRFRERILEIDKDLRSFQKLDKSMVKDMDQTLSDEIDELMKKAEQREMYASPFARFGQRR